MRQTFLPWVGGLLREELEVGEEGTEEGTVALSAFEAFCRRSQASGRPFLDCVGEFVHEETSVTFMLSQVRVRVRVRVRA